MADLKRQNSVLEDKCEAIIKATSIITKFEDYAIPIPGAATASFHLPRPMTEDQWKYLLDSLTLMKKAIVS